MYLRIRDGHFTTIPDDALHDLTVATEFSLTNGLLNHVPDLSRCVALTVIILRQQNISFVPRLVWLTFYSVEYLLYNDPAISDV